MKFLVDIRGFHGSKLYSGRRVDQVSLNVEFDQRSYQTDDSLVENDGEAYWNFERSFVFEVPDNDSQAFLEQRSLRISCYHEAQGFHGNASVDLHTIATGPVEHDLPFLNMKQEQVGRISFSVSMEQFSLVRAHFLSFRVNHLQPLIGHSRTHPVCKTIRKFTFKFLRYGFYEAWKFHHQYKESSVIDDVESPEWSDLQDLEFMASIPRILRGAIEVHICHHGTLVNDEYARCCITFGKSVDKLLEPEHEFSFIGSVKYHDASVEGKLKIQNLPKYVQMIPHSSIQKALHTETGIHNAEPVAPGFEQPHVPIFVVDTDEAPSNNNFLFDLPQIDSKLWKELQEGELHTSSHESNVNHSTKSFWKSSSEYEQL